MSDKTEVVKIKWVMSSNQLRPELLQGATLATIISNTKAIKDNTQ